MGRAGVPHLRARPRPLSELGNARLQNKHQVTPQVHQNQPESSSASRSRSSMGSNAIVQAKLVAFHMDLQVLLGDLGTGKTSIVVRFAKGLYYECQARISLCFFESTIGAAFFSQVLALDAATVKLDIWDTAGQERYHSLAPMYYRGAAAAIVVFDITREVGDLNSDATWLSISFNLHVKYQRRIANY
ncbi:hypothetical protein PR202_ga14570 [Eleusine coracana subsp. coracana]|uniref:Uncharacterized protein n=1 Tax=Eleusine coracana subsp. coracana TaxID=191504 RepID=A0AAV5CGZ9_ELECO|nr:hypothetical protein PR202_ga14570 [Eleusine coracana subsp. coracana]